jgi:hypothetical protein
LIYVDKKEKPQLTDTLGPFETNVPTDSIAWEIKQTTGGLTVTPSKGIGKTIIVAYELPNPLIEASLTFELTPIHKGKTGDATEFSKTFKAKPDAPKQPIQLAKTSARLTLKANQKNIDIPKQALSCNQAKPYQISWKLNTERTSKEVKLDGIPASGTGDIDGFTVALNATVKSAKVVFDVTPSKEGFESLKGSYVITLSGSPCDPPDQISDYNQKIMAIVEDINDTFKMYVRIADPDEKADYLKDLTTSFAKLKILNIQVDGHNSISAYLKSGFSKVPVVNVTKNECGTIETLKVNP